MDNHSLKIMEYNEILNLLAEEAGSQIGKEKALALFPSDDIDEVRSMLNETEEAFRVLDEGEIPYGGIRDIRIALKIARHQGRLDCHQLLDVAQNLEVLQTIRAFFNSKKDKYPFLWRLIQYLKPYKDIVEAINTSISPKGEIYSNASPKLSSLRRTIEDLRQTISSKMGEILKSSHHSKMLQETIITTREGRYVLPVRAEYKNQFKGIVHDQSSSGVTLFMEPLSLVDKNNRLREALLEEKEEIETILRQLSHMISEEVEFIENNLEILTDMDLIIAKGRLAHRLRAVRPVITKEKKIKIIRGRHPLIKGEIVPISIEIGENFKCLVITGPNTGGKTVTLKMTGLFILMAKTGLFIPAGEGTLIPCIKGIYADIGDEQSIAQSLSTFSSHIKQIGKILTLADENSLVLLDELGAGTDPSEGAALAISILEYLIKCGSLTIVTSHHNKMKAFAAIHPKAENASVDFDIETLSPTYHLSIGQPGRSQALIIAERLGILPEIIENARENLPQNTFEVDSLLEKIKIDSDTISEEKEKASIIKIELEELKRRVKIELEEEKLYRKKTTEDLIEKSQRLLSSAQKEVKETRQTLKKLLKNQKNINLPEALSMIEELQKNLGMEEKKVEDFISAVLPVKLPEPVEKVSPGDYVEVISLGLKGYVTEVFAESKEVKLQAGMMNMTAKISDLARATGADYKSPEETYNNYVSSLKSISVSGELKLISKRVEEALIMLEKYLDDATLAHHKEVRIVHGKGTGALRAAVRDYLKTSPLVNSFRLGGVGEGGAGVTIVELNM
ncbi:MAG TPA: endonuclease MutS2 [Candidatus Eremiobacteraeota bacterium]|nr:endonuclease MutS2 [Candidatus Eremiobacteraeota bacterium]